MHRIALTLLTIACALLAVSGPAAAQVYKWTDENGKVHYGVDCDKPGAINQWVQQDRPMTAEQQRAAVAARNARNARETAARRY
jgi:Domain of unknown function (DUF4124)